jgi:hypothetical protein
MATTGKRATDMHFDPSYRIDLIAEDTSRAVLQHVLITTWHDEPVAVAADGYTMAVVPVELDPSDVRGLLHVSVLSRAFELAGIGQDDSLSYPSEVRIRLGHMRAQLSDGSIMPRIMGTAVTQFPDWQKVIPQSIAAPDLEPVFGIQPALLAKTADALGHRMVGIHRANSTQIVIAPNSVGSLDLLVPPFAVMMLAHLSRPDTRLPVVEDQLMGARS